MKILAYDLETRKGPICRPDGSKDWCKRHMGVSCGAAWINWQGGARGRYLLFQAHAGLDGARDKLNCEMEHLAALIEEADLVLDYNGMWFDRPLLEAWLDREVNYPHDRHEDLFVSIVQSLGKRVSLDNVALYTLGEGKSNHGSTAPKMAQDGRYGKLFTYCMRDVELVVRLFEFAKAHGYVMCRPRKGADPLTRVPLQVPTGRPAWEPKLAYEKQPNKGELASHNQIYYLMQLFAQNGRMGWQPPRDLRKDVASKWIRALKQGFMPHGA